MKMASFRCLRLDLVISVDKYCPLTVFVCVLHCQNGSLTTSTFWGLVATYPTIQEHR